jgi:O-antigen ligase
VVDGETETLRGFELPVMSPLLALSEGRALVGAIRRRQVIDVVRAATFVGALLAAWISLRPFIDLGNADVTSNSTGNDTLTYVLFGGLALLTAFLTMRQDTRGLATLLSPLYVAFACWIVASVVLSSDPATSVKRFALTASAAAVAAMLFLLPKSRSEMARWFSVAVLGLLATCYLGVVLAANLSIHLATDVQEPLLAGDWRGAFGHKNVAAAMMAMVLFLGIYVARSGLHLAGLASATLAAIFLVRTGGKSALVLCVAVIVLSSLTLFVRSFWLRAVLLLSPLLLLNMLSVGTVMSERLAAIAEALPLDTSFTGRTEIWTFALQSVQQRLAFGYGFSAFWGTGAVRGLPEGYEWATTVAHSHNGYLDTALAMGLPGLGLLVAVLVIVPLRNFHLADRSDNNGPLTMMLLRIWLFGIYLSAFESFFLDRADPIWFTFLIAVFGLHYLARFRAVK